jgi:hypothetical protein
VPDEIARLARAQLGLVTRVQACTALTENQIEHRLATGRLEAVRHGVYRVAGSPETWEQHLLAACLAGGVGAAVSFRCAAWLWQLGSPERPDELEITVPRGRRARLPGVIAHDTRVVGRLHFTRLGPIPITTPARTLCDSTAYAPDWVVERALDDALRRRITTLRNVTRVFVDLATKGRRRSTIMRAVLDDRLPGFQPGDSQPEVRIATWLSAAGLPKPVQQHRVRVGNRTYRMDLAYPVEKIDIEYDGWETHRQRGPFDENRDRDAILEVDAGWLVMRFTSKSGRATIVERVAKALANRST